MAVDTFAQVWNRVLLRCPSLGPKLAQDFTRNAFRRLAERRRWSWLTRYGQFLAPASYSTGTVSVTHNEKTVTGTGTTFTAAMVGRQFRVGLNAPIYTIESFTSATSIELDFPYGESTNTSTTFEIYQCFFPVPADFNQFITIWDPQYNWQLYPNVTQEELNLWDAQRASTGNSYVSSFRDYTASRVGVVSQPVQVDGSGPDPTSGGSYTGPADALFSVEITTGGASGTAVFQWKKDDGSYTTGVTTDAAANAQTLQDGVSVAFPLAQTYVLGDVWVIRTTAVSNPGVARYELWPHAKTQKPYPFLYEIRYDDLSDPGVVLPSTIRGDALLESAMAEVASWPGPSTDKPNPYFSRYVAARHDANAQREWDVLEVQDDNIWVQDLQYQYPALGWGWAVPFGDSDWLQSHAL